MPKRNAIKPEERRYIQENCLIKTDEDLAKELDRDIRTIRSWRRKLGIHKGATGKLEKININGQKQNTTNTQVIRKLTEEEKKKFFQTQLINTLFYDNLKEQFTAEEIEFYLEEWGSLCLQFEDVVQTEKRQIDEYIKAEIMANRILRNIRVAEDEIENLIEEVHKLYKKTDIKNDEQAQERDFQLQNMIRIMHSQTQVMANDYQKNVELRNDLLSELNARRRDRIDQLKKSKTTFIGLIEAFRDKEIREAHGRHMELVRLAKEKKKTEWRKPIRFSDGTEDCVLMDEESILPEKQIVLLEDMKCDAIDKFKDKENKSILIIDDEFKRHQYFYDVFKNNNLFLASTCVDAEKLLQTRKYDLICLDYDLGLNQKGSQVAEYILKEDLCKETEFLIHSMNKEGSAILAKMLNNNRKIEVMPFEDILKLSEKKHA